MAFGATGALWSSAAHPSGALQPLKGAHACVAVSGPRVCARGRALMGVSDVAVSPDGHNVYAATRQGVASFSRARRTGALTQLRGRRGCVTPAGGVCSVGRSVDDARAIAVSPDGENVYVAGISATSAFARDRKTGALTQLPGAAGCLRRDGADGCGPARIPGDHAIAVSADGTTVYAGGYGGMGVFARDPTSGALSELPGASGCIRPADEPPDGCLVARGLGTGGNRYVGGVAVSGDGRDVYASANGGEDGESGLALFRRDTATGAISQRPGDAACFGAEPGCWTGLRGRFSNLDDVAISPNGRSVYVAAEGGGAGAEDLEGGIITLRRNATSGALSQPAGTAGCVAFRTDASERCGRARVFHAADLAVSPDSRFVYVTDSWGVPYRPNAIGGIVGVFARALKTGGLDQLHGRAGCVSRFDRCTRTPATAGPNGIAISPDGRNAYVGLGVGRFGAVASFRRAR